MSKRTRAELANEKSPPESAEAIREANRARIDDEPEPPRAPTLSVGTHVWYIDASARWFEVEVVGRSTSGRVMLRPVTGWDDRREVEWHYPALIEFQAAAVRERLRHISTRRR